MTGPMTPLDELSTLLKPAGAGLFLVSTGRAEQQQLQRALYRVSTDDEVQQRFRQALERVASAKGVVLGIPSDVGAGFQRGANLGPQAIRSRLLEDDPDWPARCDALGLVDVGDVFVVPQLLHDDMLSASQLAASRQALYPGHPDADRLPVSPLSIAERAWTLLLGLNPSLKVFTLGGDHSTAWPVVRPLNTARGGAPWGIVQSDAHTDLLEHRLGVKYCFATWSWHANEVLGRQGRLTQVGIRATLRSREHWESTLGVRQVWARDVRANPDRALDDVLAHVKATGVNGVFFSNDIDGTDSAWADATGTPEPEGLEPDWVVALIRRLGAEVGLLGGDVMEVAPSLTRRPDSARRTVGLAARYFRETVQATFPATR
jgi:arginase family enzyme